MVADCSRQWPPPPLHLAPGDRLPDFRGLDQHGLEWQLYERLLGQPLLLHVLRGNRMAPLPSALARLIDTVPDCQLVVLCAAPLPDHAALGNVLALPVTVLRVPLSLLDLAAPPGADTWLLADRNLRVRGAWATVPSAEELRGVLDDAGIAACLCAPVLTVPRVLLPDECARLIAWYARQGGQPSGMPFYAGGRQHLVVDRRAKVRHDLRIGDERLGQWLAGLLSRRLLPEIERAFCWRAQGYESFKLVCYGEQGSGYFRPHRDNLAPQAAHRRFAVTVNLNGGEYSGGELRFPEFGPAGYAPPAGGAVVFSCALAHEVSDITSGRRYALLTFLY